MALLDISSCNIIVFENLRKKSHSTWRAIKNAQNDRSILTTFGKPETCSQTVLPDR